MTLRSLESAHLLPRSVHDLLLDATAAGLCGPTCHGSGEAPSGSTYGWVLHRGSLLVWRAEDDLQATMRRLALPSAPSGRVFVEVLPHAGSSALTVVLCTGGGLLCVWLDANFFAPPYTQQLFVSAGASGGGAGAPPPGDAVTALAASTVDAAGAPGFVAVVGTADGALHLYHGSQAGIFPRQFHAPAGPAGPAAAARAGDGGGEAGGGAGAGGGGSGAGGGLLGSLGGVVKALYSEAFDPLYRVLRPAASRLPARALALLRAGGAGAAGGAWRLLALTGDALDCWALGAANAASAADERLLWSYNLAGVLLEELRATKLEPLALAAAFRRSGAGGAGAAEPQLLVWSGFTGAATVTPQHALTVFDLRADFIPFNEGSLVVSGAAAGALPRPPGTVGGAPGWRLLAHPRAASALARAPNGAVVEWLPAAGETQVRRAGRGRAASRVLRTLGRSLSCSRFAYTH
jgi:hypothetical protein